MSLQVELVSPERIVWSGEAEMVIARTVGGGDIAFMPGHAPFVGALEIATASVVSGDKEEQIAVHGGFVEVTSEPAESAAGTDPAEPGAGAKGAKTIVTILSDVAEVATEIDVERAKQARERATEDIKTGEGKDDESEREVGAAEAALRRAHVRLAAADAL